MLQTGARQKRLKLKGEGSNIVNVQRMVEAGGGRMAGRPAIPRGRVEARSWWNDVALDGSAVGGFVLDSLSREEHWHWLREGRVIYGHWKTSGEKPERVLFCELRAEEWDAAPVPRRLTVVCGDESCINPWHREISTGAGRVAGRTEDQTVSMRPYEWLENAAKPVDTANAYQIYIALLEDDAAWARHVDAEGRLKFGPELRKWTDGDDGLAMAPSVVAIGLVAHWLEMDPMISMSEAREGLEEATKEMRAARNAAQASVRDRREKARRS